MGLMNGSVKNKKKGAVARRVSCASWMGDWAGKTCLTDLVRQCGRATVK